MSKINTASNWSSSMTNAATARNTRRMLEVMEAQAAAQGIETPSMARDRIREEKRATQGLRAGNIRRHNAKLARKGLTPCADCSTCSEGGGGARRGLLAVIAFCTFGLSLLVIPFEKKCTTCGCHTSFGNQH